MGVGGRSSGNAGTVQVVTGTFVLPGAAPRAADSHAGGVAGNPLDNA